LAPTLLANAGIAAPTTMQGRDLAPLLHGRPTTDWRTDFFYEHAIIQKKEFIPSSQAVVSLNEKLLHWPDFQVEELFDLTTDPREERNRLTDPTMTTTLARLRMRLDELRTLAK
jgi:arylsulfatase A-like enzyme